MIVRLIRGNVMLEREEDSDLYSKDTLLQLECSEENSVVMSVRKV